MKPFREDVETKTSELAIEAVYSLGNFDLDVEQDPIVEPRQESSHADRTKPKKVNV